MDRRRLLARLVEWAQAEENIRAVVLTGSTARGSDADDLSDLDVELYTRDPSVILDDRSWYARFGTVLAVEELPNPGWHPTRLLYLRGAKVDLMVAPDHALAGTRYERPYRVLVDKDALSTGLGPPERSDTRPPDGEAFSTCVNWFSAAALMCARCIARGEPWMAKFRDWDLKRQLLTMIEWDHKARHGWDHDTWFNGKHLDRWVDPDIRSALERCWAGFGLPDAAAALLASLDLFEQLAHRTATALGAGPPDCSAVRQEVQEILSRDGVR